MPKMLLQQPLLQAQRLLAWATGATASSTQSTPYITQDAATASQPLPSSLAASATLLFGATRPWNESGKVNWTSVDDRVRGGNSVSHLEPQAGYEGLSARFYGNLDTKTLGGAGFASVTTTYDDNSTSLDLSSFDGILIRIEASDDKRYTFIVKDDVPGSRDDGRMKSGISWEYDFHGSLPLMEDVPNCSVSNDLFQICIPWSKLRATYRGREVKDPAPLKTDQIKRFSLMIRSFFDKQDGDFDITFASIWAYSDRKGEAMADDSGNSKAHL